MTSLAGKKILVLVSNGVDKSVMSVTQRELIKTGAVVRTVGIEPGLVNSWNSVSNGWGMYFPIDQHIAQTLGADFDCIVVPSGSRGILKLSNSPHSERILASFLTAQKPMAFMGDAAVLLEKTGLGNQDGNPNVMSGDSSDVAGFIAKMVVHFAGDASALKAAA